MIGVGEHKEHVLQQAEVVRLEEAVRHARPGGDDVVNQLDADAVLPSAVLRRGRGAYLRPISAMSRMVCFVAHTTESINSLNWALGRLTSASNELRLIARRRRKNATRCSGYSAKSWLIMLSVHSKTASSTAGILSVMSGCGTSVWFPGRSASIRRDGRQS